MLVFDTHSFYKSLEKVGFTKDQAETVTDLIKETQQNSFEIISKNLATKAELFATKTELKEEILLNKTELKDEIHQVKVDLIKWIVTLLLAQTGIIAALVKLL